MLRRELLQPKATKPSNPQALSRKERGEQGPSHSRPHTISRTTYSLGPGQNVQAVQLIFDVLALLGGQRTGNGRLPQLGRVPEGLIGPAQVAQAQLGAAVVDCQARVEGVPPPGRGEELRQVLVNVRAVDPQADLAERVEVLDAQPTPRQFALTQGVAP